jgi:hypothetical protein
MLLVLGRNSGLQVLDFLLDRQNLLQLLVVEGLLL